MSHPFGVSFLVGVRLTRIGLLPRDGFGVRVFLFSLGFLLGTMGVNAGYDGGDLSLELSSSSEELSAMSSMTSFLPLLVDLKALDGRFSGTVREAVRFLGASGLSSSEELSSLVRLTRGLLLLLLVDLDDSRFFGSKEEARFATAESLRFPFPEVVLRGRCFP